MTLQSVVQASPNQVSCDLGGNAAILNTETGAYYGLDPVGAFIWNFIAQPRAVSDVRDAVIDGFEVDLQRCEQDVVRLLGSLAAEGLIEVRDAPNRG